MNFRKPFLVLALSVTAFFLTACGATIQVVPVTSHRPTMKFPNNDVAAFIRGHEKRCKLESSKKGRITNGVKVVDYRDTETCIWLDREYRECTSKTVVTTYDKYGPNPEKDVKFKTDCRPRRR